RNPLTGRYLVPSERTFRRVLAVVNGDALVLISRACSGERLPAVADLRPAVVGRGRVAVVGVEQQRAVGCGGDHVGALVTGDVGDQHPVEDVPPVVDLHAAVVGSTGVAVVDVLPERPVGLGGEDVAP